MCNLEKGSGMGLVTYTGEMPAERQHMCSDFIRTISSVIKNLPRCSITPSW